MLRKVGIISALMLTLPTLASAWTLTAKIGSGAGTITSDIVTGTTVTRTAAATSPIVGYFKTATNLGADTVQVITLGATAGYRLSSVILDGVQQPAAVADGSLSVPVGSPIKNHSLVAYYTAVTYNLTVTQPTGGKVHVQRYNAAGTELIGSLSRTGFGGLKSGDKIKVTALPNSDYRVSSIAGDSTASGLQGDVVSKDINCDGANFSTTAIFGLVPKVVARLEAAKLTAKVGDTVALDSTETTANGAIAYDYSVTGSTGATIVNNGSTATITFANPGTFAVKLTATSGVATSESVRTIVVSSVVGATNDVCLGCHSTRNETTVTAYNAGTHGHTGVTCQSCHTGTHTSTSPVVQLNTTTAPIVDKGNGFVTATVCANCHKKSHDEWAGSLHTLKAKKGPALLDGSTANISPWALANWNTTQFKPYQILGRKIEIKSKNYIEMYVSMDKKQPEDVAIVIGQNRKQRYAVYYDGSAQQAQVVYSNNGGETYREKMIDHDNNPATAQVWEEVAMPAQPDRAGYMFLWLEVKLTSATPTMNANNYEEWRSWQERCIGCHTTGFDRDAYNTQMAAYKAAMGSSPTAPTGIDMRQLFITEWEISCENCHGPGKQHADTGDIAKIVSPSKLNKADATANQTRRMVCESCHTRTQNNLQAFITGTSGTALPTGNKTANDRRGFVLGDAVNGVYSKWMDYTNPAWGSGNRQVSIDGKGRRDHQMTMDIQLSKYIKETIDGGFSYHGNQNCFDCHKSHDIGVNKNGVNQFQVNMAAAKYGHDNMKGLATDDGVRSTLRLKDTREALCTPCHVTSAPAGALPDGVVAPHYNSVDLLVKVLDAKTGVTPAYGYTFSPTAAVLNTSAYAAADAAGKTTIENAMPLVESVWNTEGGRDGRQQHIFNTSATAAATNKAMGLVPAEYTWQITTALAGISTNSADYTAIWPWANAASGKTKVYGPLPTSAASKAPTTSRPWTP